MTAPGRQTWRSSWIDTHDDETWRVWDALNTRWFESHPMLDSRFTAASCNYFAGGGLLLARCAADDGPSALLLLEQKRPGVMATFSPSQSQIAPMLMNRDLVIDVDVLFACLPRLCLRLDIDNVDPEYCWAGLKPDNCFESSLYGTTMSIEIRPGRTFADYWAERPKKLRDNMKRYMKRVREAGIEIEFRQITEPGAVREAVRRYGELETLGWKGKADTAVHMDNVQGRFYAKLLGEFARSENASVFELYFNGRFVSSRLVITSESMVVMLKTTYDETYARFSPGRILLYKVLESLFETERFRAVEFYTNASRDQLAWADSTREISQLSLYRSRALRRVVSACRAVLKRPVSTSAFSLVTYDAFGELPRNVRKTWDDITRDSIFECREWFENLYRNVGRDLGELRILVLENRAGQCQAILPCVAPPGGSQEGRRLVALGNYYTPVFRIIVNEALVERKVAIQRVIDALCADLPCDSLSLSPLHFDEDIAALRSASRRHLVPVFMSSVTVNWWEDIQDLESYYRDRPSRLKSTLRRKAARLEKEDRASFDIVKGMPGLTGALEDFKHVYAASWKKPEPYPDFIERLAEFAARRGWLRLGLLHIEDRPAAVQLWFVNGETAYIYKLAYSEQFRNNSAGTLLTRHMLAELVTREGVRKLDYLTGDDAYKRDWMSRRRDMYTVKLTIARRPRELTMTALAMIRQRLCGD